MALLKDNQILAFCAFWIFFTLLPLLGETQTTKKQFLYKQEESIQYTRLRMLGKALEQSEKITIEWDPKQRDCAGFVRFLFRVSATGTSKMWVNRKGDHVDYLSADELIAYNFDSISPQVSEEQVETGDLLVYYNPQKKPEDAWHLMVLLKPPPGSKKEILAIYHNGAQGHDAAIKKVWFGDLFGALEWKPWTQNPRFKGVYRWKNWYPQKS